jgi:hypothetical protein
MRRNEKPEAALVADALHPQATPHSQLLEAVNDRLCAGPAVSQFVDYPRHFGFAAPDCEMADGLALPMEAIRQRVQQGRFSRSVRPDDLAPASMLA